MNAPRDGSIVEARAHLVLEETYRAALAKCGWTPERTGELAEVTVLVESERGVALEAAQSAQEVDYAHLPDEPLQQRPHPPGAYEPGTRARHRAGLARPRSLSG